MHGIRAARGTYVIMGDSDSSYDFARGEPYVDRLRAGYNLVMGDRLLGGIENWRDPLPAQVPRQPGLELPRPPVLQDTCGRLASSRRRPPSVRRIDLATLDISY